MNRNTSVVAVAVLLLSSSFAAADERPNILWIYVDDMSDWVGCYGHSAVATPNIDALADAGIKFERAFMPSPVCSTTRSALITGTMQTTFGLHHHRTMIKKPLPEGVLTVPELFRQAGYLTFNEAKDDYNFVRDRELMYSPEFKRPEIRSHLVGRDLTWLRQLRGKKFFGQIQLKGGKIGGETGSRYPAISRVREDDVTVPPYYPDHPVIRNAIARHYEQIAETDEQVGAITNALQKYGLWDNTVVFFFSDHGSPLPRSKQFLYEEGTKVPLLVRWPANQRAPNEPGRIRTDLVSGIDIPATSLAAAQIPLPTYIEGADLFAHPFHPRDHVVSARDRCGIAVDRIRAVRTDRFRYIRNYKTDRALYQPQYRDGHATFVQLRKMFRAGELNPLQSSYFDAARRPAEELYDLAGDPDQIRNVAGDSTYRTALQQHRALLEEWEQLTNDKGQHPASREELRAVYEGQKDKCVAPEFDFLKG
jgi:arylsulfatase A-like enzyme